MIASVPEDHDLPLYCWQEGEAEVEFLYPRGIGLVPIEVKAGQRTKSRSLSQYILRYSPELAVRLSARPMSYDQERKLINLPLPLVHWVHLL